MFWQICHATTPRGPRSVAVFDTYKGAKAAAASVLEAFYGKLSSAVVRWYWLPDTIWDIVGFGEPDEVTFVLL